MKLFFFHSFFVYVMIYRVTRHDIKMTPNSIVPSRTFENLSNMKTQHTILFAHKTFIYESNFNKRNGIRLTIIARNYIRLEGGSARERE